jgi:signal transduction histidine kinase
MAETNNDSLLIADTYNVIGNLHLTSRLFSNAARNYQTSFEIYQSLDYLEGMATETHNLALSAFKLEDRKVCISYFRQSIAIRKSTGNKRRIGDELTSLGETYLGFGIIDSSLTLLHEALGYFNDIDNYPRKLDTYAFLCDSYLESDPDKALGYLLLLEQGNKSLNIDLYNELTNLRYSKYYLRKGNYTKSETFLSRVDFESVLRYEQVDPIEMYIELSDKLRGAGQHDKALLYSQLARENYLDHDLVDAQNLISDYKTRLNIRAVESDMERERESNELILSKIRIESYVKTIVVIALFVLVIMAIYLFIGFITIRKSNSILRLQKVKLEEIYSRSVRYKERVLNTRENKSVFFSVISEKLSEPFVRLTEDLDELFILARKKGSRSRTKEKVIDLNNLAIRIMKSLKRVLLWSKLQRNKYEIRITRFNVNDYFHELLPELLGLALKKKLKIRFDIDPDLRINYDRHSLKTILRVLFENSIDHSTANSEIILRGQRGRGGAIISLTDFGMGIPGWYQNTIFDIDRKIIEQNTDGSEKLGLGLLIATQMAEKNNSHISFESKDKKGTTFFIHIKHNNVRKEDQI